MCIFASTTNDYFHAPVAELVDALDLGSSCSRSAGSSPVRRTNEEILTSVRWLGFFSFF